MHGPSGSGKTTFLSVITGILRPQTGKVRVLGQDLMTLSASNLDAFRGTHMGYIFQMFNLIPYLTLQENILLPCQLHPDRKKKVAGDLSEEAQRLAKTLGIQEHLSHGVMELSVGQQQRVAAARALIGAPELIVADEPTSALDHDHREKFLKLLFEQCEVSASSLLFVSHDRSLAPSFDRSLSLSEINKAGSL